MRVLKRMNEAKKKIPENIKEQVDDILAYVPDACFDLPSISYVETDMTRSLKGIADNTKMMDAYIDLNNLEMLGVTAQSMLFDVQNINNMLDSSLARRYNHLIELPTV
jgi:hypothetical protein